MNGLVGFFLICAGIAQCLLPRRLLSLPLLMAFAWIPRAQVLELGDIKVTAFRLIIAIGLIRVVLRRERTASGFVSMDAVWIVWSLAMLGTWALHTSNDLMFRTGLVWEYLGTYCLLRIALSGYEDIERLFTVFCAVLVPVGLIMLVERYSGENPLGFIGGLPTQWREGNYRAAGPFSHPILAGAVGSTAFLIGVSFWRRRPLVGWMGILAGAAIVHASASSSPMLMTAFGLLALALWRCRAHLTTIRSSALVLLLLLQAWMQDPVYYLMAKIDVVGGSTGWHRARLIQAALEHFDEWWLAGTDRTVHWMPTGILANDQHTDLTNHFLAMGVMGGLPLLIPFVLAVYLLIRRVDLALGESAGLDDRNQFLAWTVGALVFAHASNFLSAHLFDQTIVSFMLLFACAGVIGRQKLEAVLPTRQTPKRRAEPYDFAPHSFR